MNILATIYAPLNEQVILYTSTIYVKRAPAYKMRRKSTPTTESFES
ncbi:hypothetical protein MNBD_GAMMA10-3327 [hydrothermal vent metagenome]|uniref:Uncharacterized protein n=1 Tax=hydrothermal vent metagenome TaxID=652676 RepID=A0A3B0XNP1_9ZZZZ